MVAFITIAFSLMAFIAFCGMLGEKDAKARDNLTIGFGICAAIVLAINIIGGVL